MRSGSGVSSVGDASFLPPANRRRLRLRGPVEERAAQIRSEPAWRRPMQYQRSRLRFPERLQPSPSVLRAIALAGLLIAGCSLAFALTNDGITGVQVALLEWISLPYIAAGLVAWWRRPDSRLGVLMIVGGFATGLSGLAFAGYALPHTLGLVFDILPVVIFLHVYLAFPDGRLRSAFRASAGRGRVRVGDRSPARQDVARRGRRAEPARSLDAAGGGAHAGAGSASLDQRALPCRARRARGSTASHRAGRCAVRRSC